MRADENGSTAVRCQPTGGGQADATAAVVALGLGSEAAMAPRAAVAAASSQPPTGCTDSKEISPVVIVPVLSRQRVSTLASSSTAASSLARARRRARAITPATNASEVSRTSPSGTIATAAPTVPRSASCQRSSAPSRRQNSRALAGGISHTSTRRIRFTPVRNSESTRVKRRASSLSAAA